jgi:hypothetical protein
VETAGRAGNKPGDDANECPTVFPALKGKTSVRFSIMVTKYTKWFEETAADPVRRRAAIGDYSRRRTILICCAFVATGCALATFYPTPQSPKGTAALTFAAAMMWILCSRVGSDLRTLKKLDRILG